MKQKQPHALFDAVIAHNKLKNDAAMCRLLRLQPSHVSRMRTGDLPVTDNVRIAVMRKCRWPLRRVDELAPPEAETEQADQVAQ